MIFGLIKKIDFTLMLFSEQNFTKTPHPFNHKHLNWENFTLLNRQKYWVSTHKKTAFVTHSEKSCWLFSNFRKQFRFSALRDTTVFCLCFEMLIKYMNRKEGVLKWNWETLLNYQRWRNDKAVIKKDWRTSNIKLHFQQFVQSTYWAVSPCAFHLLWRIVYTLMFFMSTFFFEFGGNIEMYAEHVMKCDEYKKKQKQM